MTPEQFSIVRDGSYHVIPVSLHGNHTNIPGDDGMLSPELMAEANLYYGVPSAITGHSTAGGLERFQQAYRDAGVADLALLGVEWGSKTEAQEISGGIQFSIDHDGNATVSPTTDRFRSQQPSELSSQFIPKKELDMVFDDLKKRTSDAFKLPVAEVIAFLKKQSGHGYVYDIHTPNDPVALQILSNSYLRFGLQRALEDDDFDVYAAVQRRKQEGPELTEEEQILLTHDPLIQYATWGYAYIQDRATLTRDTYKSEIVTLLPPNASPELVKKIADAAAEWRTFGHHTSMDHIELFNFIQSRIGGSSLDQMTVIEPHPIGIRSPILKIKEGAIQLHNPRTFDPDVKRRVKGIEIYNGGHPLTYNHDAVVYASMEENKHIPTLANSDSHDYHGVPSAANLVWAEEVSAAGILDAVAQGRVVPFTTHGNHSPFPFWLTTQRQLAGINWVPEKVRRRMRPDKDIVRTTGKILFDAGMRPEEAQQKRTWAYTRKNQAYWAS